jgi:hypothetical protein
MTAERGDVIGKPHVRVYLDDNPQPIIDREPPTDIDLDTLSLADGAHRLVIRAAGQNGREGVEEIPFVVHNGPGIIVSGLRHNSIRSGNVRFTVDAFSADDPFDPRRAEARSQIPVWVWVMSLSPGPSGMPLACGMCQRPTRKRPPTVMKRRRKDRRASNHVGR